MLVFGDRETHIEVMSSAFAPRPFSSSPGLLHFFACPIAASQQGDLSPPGFSRPGGSTPPPGRRTPGRGSSGDRPQRRFGQENGGRHGASPKPVFQGNSFRQYSLRSSIRSDRAGIGNLFCPRNKLPRPGRVFRRQPGLRIFCVNVLAVVGLIADAIEKCFQVQGHVGVRSRERDRECRQKIA